MFYSSQYYLFLALRSRRLCQPLVRAITEHIALFLDTWVLFSVLLTEKPSPIGGNGANLYSRNAIVKETISFQAEEQDRCPLI